jgi:hypothetical protein
MFQAGCLGAFGLPFSSFPHRPALINHAHNFFGHRTASEIAATVAGTLVPPHKLTILALPEC